MSHELITRTIVPMKGKADTLPRGDQWVYELKWDGMRVLAFLVNGTVRLQSSNGRDVTASFPELQALADVGANFNGMVLDGEVVAFDGTQPSFNALQGRMHVTDPADAARRARHTPVIFVAFDLLHLDGHDTMALPLANRRTLLEQLENNDPCWTICEQHTENVDALLDVVIETGLEGLMAKRVSSAYQPGRRSTDWIKIKPTLRQEFVVGGWLAGRGNRKNGLGSLLLGVYQGNDLVFAGRAGSGLTETAQHEWLSVLVEHSNCPFTSLPDTPNDRAVRWCEPTQIAEIKFSEWPAGHQIRHPVVVGRRTDKDPTTIVREH